MTNVRYELRLTVLTYIELRTQEQTQERNSGTVCIELSSGPATKSLEVMTKNLSLRKKKNSQFIEAEDQFKRRRGRFLCKSERRCRIKANWLNRERGRNPKDSRKIYDEVTKSSNTLQWLALEQSEWRKGVCVCVSCASA